MTTSMKLKLDGVDVKKVTDETFTKDKRSASEKGRDFFNAEGKKKEVSKERLGLQKTVDAALTKAQGWKKGDITKSYLAARFSLGKNDKVHSMKF